MQYHCSGCWCIIPFFQLRGNVNQATHLHAMVILPRFVPGLMEAGKILGVLIKI